jgi:cobalt/nickel transport system permease protein
VVQPTLFAVHLSDGVVAGSWLVGGWIVAALVVAAACRRIGEADVPRIGVLTAAFFVGSQVHLPLGGVSAHLLLNGLVGVVLGVRAGLVIAVGLLLQALLFGHGGLTVLGVNVAIYALPAVAAGAACGPLRRSGAVRVPAVRFALVFAVAAVWLATAVVAGQWARAAVIEGRDHFPHDPADWWLAEPVVAVAVLLAAAAVAWAERWLESDPEFAVGLLLGAVTAYATVALDVLVLAVGGVESVRPVAGVALLANLPVVLVESVGVGFVVAFLAKARPEWVGCHRGAGSGSTSSNGTSH